MNPEIPEKGTESESTEIANESIDGGTESKSSARSSAEPKSQATDEPRPQSTVEVRQVPSGKSEPVSVQPVKGSALAVIALFFSIAALAGSGWLFWNSGQQETETATVEVANQMSSALARQDELEKGLNELISQITDLNEKVGENVGQYDGQAELTRVQRQLEGRLEGLDATAAGTRQQLAQLGARQGTLATQLQSTITAMQSRLLAMESGLATVASGDLNASAELGLDEVDFLLRLASERLQLFADTASASLALRLADQHLEALDSPLYISVRQQISTSLDQLARTTMPDYFATTQKIDELQNAVLRTPFRGERQTAVSTEPESEAGWWGKLKATFSGLVTVKRQTENEVAVMSLEDKDLIRQGIWLQFETARLALMRGDQAVFTAALEQSVKTIDEWFDGSDGNLTAIRGSIVALSELQLSQELPDISGPWSQLRQLRSGQAAIRSAAARADASAISAAVQEPMQEAVGESPVEQPE